MIKNYVHTPLYTHTHTVYNTNGEGKGYVLSSEWIILETHTPQWNTNCYQTLCNTILHSHTHTHTLSTTPMVKVKVMSLVLNGLS